MVGLEAGLVDITHIKVSLSTRWQETTHEIWEGSFSRAACAAKQPEGNMDGCDQLLHPLQALFITNETGSHGHLLSVRWCRRVASK